MGTTIPRQVANRSVNDRKQINFLEKNMKNIKIQENLRIIGTEERDKFVRSHMKTKMGKSSLGKLVSLQNTTNWPKITNATHITNRAIPTLDRKDQNKTQCTAPRTSILSNSGMKNRGTLA